MSKLSLREIAQSQLDSTPVIDGQLIVCLDTGNAYRDTATAHVKIGSDLEVVSDLPLAPLAEKLYYLKPDKLYVFLGGNWTLLNGKAIDLDESIAKLPAGSSTTLNDDVEITVLEIKGDQVKLGVSAPKSVPVYRKEVYVQIQDANKAASESEGVAALKELLK